MADSTEAATGELVSKGNADARHVCTMFARVDRAALISSFLVGLLRVGQTIF
jgi:hypothetical protein